MEHMPDRWREKQYVDRIYIKLDKSTGSAEVKHTSVFPVCSSDVQVQQITNPLLPPPGHCWSGPGASGVNYLTGEL